MQRSSFTDWARDWYGLRPLFLWTLRKLLFFWVKAAVLPDDPRSQIDPAKPVCYVLDLGGLSNRLALDHVCLVNHMPRPEQALRIPGHKSRSITQMRRLRGWFVRRADSTLPHKFELLMAAARDDTDFDVQIVPVSIFWGRSPEKERSWMRTLFSNAWSEAGRLRKAFIIMVHGRNTLVQVSPPVSIREFADEDLTTERAVRKMSRVLRVHFRRLRIAAVGPDLSHRPTLVSQLLDDPAVQKAVDREVATSKQPRKKVLRKARKYANEIAADYSYTTIRVMDRLLTWLWNRIYSGVEVNHPERLLSAVDGNEVVYLPCHRSHIDYLLLSYVVYYQGLVPPHIAAGINLNMPVIGGILRRGGAFYIRRSFKGNRLYTTVFDAYLSNNLAKGVSIEYFVEGTRSRTGGLLPPRPGMLAMTVNSYLRNTARPIVMLPVYFGYERLIEGETYIGELSGHKKRSESVFGLLRSFGALREDFGKVQVNFGEPLLLDEFLDRCRPSWRDEQYEPGKRPEWLADCIEKLGETVMTRINQVAAVTPVNLVGTALLSTPKNAMPESELIQQVALYQDLLAAAPYSEDVTVADSDAAEIVAYCERMQVVSRESHTFGDILLMADRDAVLMSYFRNNTLHLFVAPSLVACCLLNNRTMDGDEVHRLCELVYPYLQAELFLQWDMDAFHRYVDQVIGAMAKNGLVQLDAASTQLTRPASGSLQSAQLRALAQAVLPILERYYLTAALLLKHPPGTLRQAELENACQLAAQRISLLHEFNAPEFFAKVPFRSFINTLQASGLIWKDDQRALCFDERIANVERDADRVLNEQIRHRIMQVTRG